VPAPPQQTAEVVRNASAAEAAESKHAPSFGGAIDGTMLGVTQCGSRQAGERGLGRRRVTSGAIRCPRVLLLLREECRMSTGGSPISELQIETDPGAVGMDPERLDRIDRHFTRYVEEGKLPGWLIVVSRGGKVVYLAARGHRNMESAAPVEIDTRWRIFCMTKAITSVAAMILYEEGGFDLTDDVSDFIPSFADMRVYVDGSPHNMVTEGAHRPITIWHLLTHTSGLTYDFYYNHPVDAMYRARVDRWWEVDKGLDMAGRCDMWARLPLLFHPGDEWNYSVATDVLGRIVEIVSGETLKDFCRIRIFDVLDMNATTFGSTNPQQLAALYARDEGRITRDVDRERLGLSMPTCLSGGAGLVSTAGDFHRFMQMLLNRGTFGGRRLLSGRTVDYMTRNHLGDGTDLRMAGRPLFAKSSLQGMGFGLGFAVTIDPVLRRAPSSLGEYTWWGGGSTVFWIDPVEDLTVAFYAQLISSGRYPVPELHQLVHQALVD
jgi:CubicO group peptidase (beta-lactamase class C family)